MNRKNKSKQSPVISKLSMLLTLGLCVFAIYVANWQGNKKELANEFSMISVPALKEQKPKEVKASPKFDYIQLMPDSNENYRSKQLSYQQLDQLCASGKIDRIIRLNGDYEDRVGVSLHEEQMLCRKHKIQFLFLNAHEPATRIEVANWLLKGKSLIHCKHGYDRTGAIVGWYLRSLSFTKSEVIAHNKWENYLEEKGDEYLIYYDMIQ